MGFLSITALIFMQKNIFCKKNTENDYGFNKLENID